MFYQPSKRTNMRITGISEREKKGTESLKKSWKHPKIVRKDMNVQVYEANR